MIYEENDEVIDTDKEQVILDNLARCRATVNGCGLDFPRACGKPAAFRYEVEQEGRPGVFCSVLFCGEHSAEFDETIKGDEVYKSTVKSQL